MARRKKSEGEEPRAHKSRRSPMKRRVTIRFKIAAVFALFIAALLLLLNIYPVTATRDLVFTTKETSMQAQGQVISSSLSALDTLSSETVEQVMQLLDVTGMTRIIITDADAFVLYDTADEINVGRCALLSEVISALEGQTVFYCDYSDGSFRSRTAMPIMSGGTVCGAVYLYEYDAGQASLISGLQRNLLNISVLFAAAGLVVIMVLSGTLTRRIKSLIKAIRIVREGDYSYRIKIRGRDDIALTARELNVLIGRLESTEEMRRRFVSDASHELRTPLAAIRLLTDSIIQSENMDTATMRDFVSDIGQEAGRLQRITEKLMSLTKMDAGVGREQVEPTDLKAVVLRALHMLEPLAGQQGITIETDLADDCIVMASPDELYQIVFNLAENGIKYNTEGGSVRLALRREGSRVVLITEDTGIGIPEVDRKNIFGRFYRVDKARSRATGGSGLGLAIVHDAVLANNGRIEVAPGTECGTRFTVSFPLVKRRNRQ